jgi:O-antigen/teichoic acid export membrane protein
MFVVFNRAFDYVATSLRGVGQFNAVAAIEAVGALVLLGGGIAVTAADLGVSAVLAVFCAKELGSAVVGYLLLRGDLDRPPPRPTVRWVDLVRVGIRLSVAGIALALVMRIPLAVLGNTGTTREVALFSAAQRFGDAAVLLATTSGFALLPGISLLARSDPERARRLVQRVLVGLGATSVVLAAVLLPIAEPTMRLIFGSDYAGGDDLLRIFLSGLPSYTVLGVCWYAIIAFDDEARLLWIGLTGFVLAAASAAIVIPQFGGEGAAWTYVGAIYAMATISLISLLHRLARLPSTPPTGHLEGAPALEVSAG